MYGVSGADFRAEVAAVTEITVDRVGPIQKEDGRAAQDPDAERALVAELLVDLVRRPDRLFFHPVIVDDAGGVEDEDIHAFACFCLADEFGRGGGVEGIHRINVGDAQSAAFTGVSASAFQGERVGWKPVMAVT